MPTPNRGAEIAGLSYMHVAVRALAMAFSKGLDPGSEPGQAATKAMTQLGKFVPPGSTSPGIENQALMELFMKQRQDQPQQQMMRALGQGGPPAPPQAPGGMPRAA